MEDSSVDVSGWTKDQILSELKLTKKTDQSLEKYRRQLRCSLEKKHPIHEHIQGLKNEDLKKSISFFFKSQEFTARWSDFNSK